MWRAWPPEGINPNPPRKVQGRFRLIRVVVLLRAATMQLGRRFEAEGIRYELRQIVLRRVFRQKAARILQRLVMRKRICVESILGDNLVLNTDVSPRFVADSTAEVHMPEVLQIAGGPGDRTGDARASHVKHFQSR